MVILVLVSNIDSLFIDDRSNQDEPALEFISCRFSIFAECGRAGGGAGLLQGDWCLSQAGWSFHCEILETIHDQCRSNHRWHRESETINSNRIHNSPAWSGGFYFPQTCFYQFSTSTVEIRVLSYKML